MSKCDCLVNRRMVLVDERGPRCVSLEELVQEVSDLRGVSEKGRRELEEARAAYAAVAKHNIALAGERNRLRADLARALEVGEAVSAECDRFKAELADWRRLKPQAAIGFRDSAGLYHEFVGPTDIQIIAH